MCYKDEKQKKNEIKLQKRFDEENISPFIQKYFVNIESQAGAINYWITIRDLLLWLIENNIIKKSVLSDITPDDFYNVQSEDITIYLRYKEKSGMAPTTLKTRKNIFSSFWEYLKRSNDCPVQVNIIESVKYKGISQKDNLVEKLPTDEQLRNMEEKLAKKNDDFLRIRNLAVFRLLKGSGIRESELAGLDMADLYLGEEIPYIKVLGKGKYREIESRTVYLTKEATDAIIEWIEKRESIIVTTKSNAVFITKTGKRLLESEIRSLFNSCSNNEVTPHMIRHWYATVMSLKAGVVFTQQQLGHTSMNTTINNYANGSYGMRDILASM